MRINQLLALLNQSGFEPQRDWQAPDGPYERWTNATHAIHFQEGPGQPGCFVSQHLPVAELIVEPVRGKGEAIYASDRTICRTWAEVEAALKK